MVVDKYLIAAMLAASSSAYAVELPKGIDMTQVVLDQNGRPAPDVQAREPIPAGQQDTDPYCTKCPRLTVGHAIMEGLFAIEQGETADKKWADGMLATRIKDNKDAILNADEVAEIKKKLVNAGAVLIMQIFPLIDPNAKPPAVKP